MECTIRVIKGSDAGLSHRLQPGASIIGRSAKAVVRLTSLDVSWEHAVITRTGDEYVLENLSAAGTYIDDAKVTGPMKLRSRDQVRLSRDTVLRFEAEGDTGWTGKRLLLTLLLLLMVAVTGLVLGTNIGRPVPDDNWDRAFYIIEPWVQDEVKHNRLPGEVASLFHDGWRLEQVKDYERSAGAWMRLQLLLDNLEARKGLGKISDEHPRALQVLLNSPIEPTPDTYEKTAALVQFVKRRQAWSVMQVNSSGFHP
jgi:hypothetical protein